MKHIKDFYNNHPNIKKGSKILGVILIVLSFLFNALVITSLAISKVSDNEQEQTLNINKANSKGLYHFNNNMYLGSASELFDVNFVTKLLRLANDNVGSYTPTSFKVENVLLKFNTPEYILNDRGTISTSGDVYVDTITLTTSYFDDTLNNGFNFYRYTIALTYGETTYFSYTAEWYIPRGYVDWQTARSNFVIGNFSNSGIRNFFFIFDRTTGNNEAVFNLVINTESYQAYEEGYNDAKEYYYNLGYIYGYNVGAGNGMSTNPFNLLSNAFSSLAGILDIQVLPNLTLGVLIFTPLIVAIIIVVVKLVKG